MGVLSKLAKYGFVELNELNHNTDGSQRGWSSFYSDLCEQEVGVGKGYWHLLLSHPYISNDAFSKQILKRQLDFVLILTNIFNSISPLFVLILTKIFNSNIAALF